MTTILHLAKTPINGHPVWLAQLQERHGDTSKVCLLTNKETGARPYHSDFRLNSRELSEYIKNVDVLHLHDLSIKTPTIHMLLAKVPRSTKIVQQWYHERSYYRDWDETHPCASPIKKVALLEPELIRLPLVIPTWHPSLQSRIVRHNRLRVIYAPTRKTDPMNYHGSKGKGYAKTLKTLQDLPSGRFDVRIIYNVNWRECQDTKQDADVVINELVTGGIGQVALESLAQGSIVIARVMPELEKLLKVPHATAGISTLTEVLCNIESMSYDKRRELQQIGPDWIRQHYSESYLYDAYADFYGAEKVYKVKRTTFVHVQDGELVTQSTPGLDLFPEIDGSMPFQPMNILQISRTNCAGAIWRIHEAFNAFTPHTCRTITFSNRTNGYIFPHDILLSNQQAVVNAIQNADVIHFHNWVDQHSRELAPFRHILAGKRCVIQYHTEPELLQRAMPHISVINRSDIKTLAIAQKHIRFYPRSTPVPNLINPENPLLTPSNRRWNGNEPLKVIYTPTDKKRYQDYRNTCCGKGYEEMMPILKRLHAKGIISLTVIDGMTWENLMPVKREHDVCIDECVTGGYHLCSLESLSQGLITIGWLDDLTQQTIASIVGDTVLPWLNTPLDRLEQTLTDLRFKTPDEIQDMKDAGRQWILDHWHPKHLIQHFVSAYGAVEKPIISQFNRTPMRPVYRQPGVILPSLRSLRSAWAGQRVVIWGNGPSAKDWTEHDFGQAKHIGTNAALKIRSDFDVYVISDLRFFHTEEKRQIAETAPGIRCYAAHCRTRMKNINGINFLQTIGCDGICSDVVRGIFHGMSVVWVGIQIALYAGATDIVLVGCEHDYSHGRFYDEGRDKAPVDNNLSRIIYNYRQLMDIAQQVGISISTAGPSALQGAGVPRSI